MWGQFLDERVRYQPSWRLDSNRDGEWPCRWKFDWVDLFPSTWPDEHRWIHTIGRLSWSNNSILNKSGNNTITQYEKETTPVNIQATGCCEDPLWINDRPSAPHFIFKRITKVKERQPWEFIADHRLDRANSRISSGAIGFATNATDNTFKLCNDLIKGINRFV